MGQNIKIEPAYSMKPGVTVMKDGVIISAVFRGPEPCGLVLYRKKDGGEVNILFTDEHRFGSLYSVRISYIDPSEWCYRLFCGSTFFIDPCSRSIESVQIGEETVRAGGFFYEPDDKLPAYRESSHPRGGETIIYCLHVRGFTMLAKGLKSRPGTFSAAAEKAPYLRELGVNAVELMPVYELQPVTRPQDGPRTMEDALALYPVSKDGLPIRDLSVKKVNYWGYSRGFYYAPNSAFGTPGYEGGPQKEFADMVEKFHSEGISVYLQLYFPMSVTSQRQIEIARFYVTHYAVDGFRLMGNITDIRAFASDPILSGVRLFHTDFPYSEIEGMDAENPESGAVETYDLFSYNDRFSTLIRRFCKSDDYVMREFLYEFFKVPAGHGNVHYVCSTDGFTLRDLVSYNDRHNEPNGEGGNDGIRDNYSWNCGSEGDSDREDVLRLRRNQIRNFLTLLFLSQSTPMINAGDECFNTQNGNNNPYCQDNETGWTGWDNGDTGEHIRDFVRRIIRFRNEHPVFSGLAPFKNTDYIGCGYPDLSLHGMEAWKPDLSHFSHAIGICLCENYVRGTKKADLIYLAINMHWEKQELGLPKLAPGRRWNLLVDTALEDSFIEGEAIVDDQHVVEVEPRSIRILCTVTSNKPVKRRKKKSTAKAVKPAAAEETPAATDVSEAASDPGAKAAAAPEAADPGAKAAATEASDPDAKAPDATAGAKEADAAPDTGSNAQTSNDPESTGIGEQENEE